MRACQAAAGEHGPCSEKTECRQARGPAFATLPGTEVCLRKPRGDRPSPGVKASPHPRPSGATPSADGEPRELSPRGRLGERACPPSHGQAGSRPRAPCLLGAHASASTAPGCALPWGLSLQGGGGRGVMGAGRDQHEEQPPGAVCRGSTSPTIKEPRGSPHREIRGYKRGRQR